ncbi:MAG: hypothetical protein RIK87_08355 [Fuerstiella sp.]
MVTMGAYNIRQDINRIKWSGWALAGTVFLCWASWLSLLAIANSNTAAVIEERQERQYEQLREDIAEVKLLLKHVLPVH